MNAREFEAAIALDRAAYFGAADELLDKLSQQYGEGPEGLRLMLGGRNKNVDNSAQYRPDVD